MYAFLHVFCGNIDQSSISIFYTYVPLFPPYCGFDLIYCHIGNKGSANKSNNVS